MRVGFLSSIIKKAQTELEIRISMQRHHYTARQPKLSSFHQVVRLGAEMFRVLIPGASSSDQINAGTIKSHPPFRSTK
jgi:hypothetical protein